MLVRPVIAGQVLSAVLSGRTGPTHHGQDTDRTATHQNQDNPGQPQVLDQDETYDETQSDRSATPMHHDPKARKQHTSCTPLRVQDHLSPEGQRYLPLAGRYGGVRCPRDHAPKAPRNRALNEHQEHGDDRDRGPAAGRRAFPAGNARGGHRGGADRARTEPSTARYGRSKLDDQGT